MPFDANITLRVNDEFFWGRHCLLKVAVHSRSPLFHPAPGHPAMQAGQHRFKSGWGRHYVYFGPIEHSVSPLFGVVPPRAGFKDCRRSR